jgi:two-component system, OmpR family, sensor histidine kinase CpxA
MRCRPYLWQICWGIKEMIRPQSLFIKIFLWFWLAMLFTVMAYSLSSTLVFDKGAKGFVSRQMLVPAITATEKYEASGKAAADAYFNLLERSTRTRFQLYDEQGNALAGQELLPAAQFIMRQAIANRTDQFDQSARTDFLAVWVDAPSGKRFLLVSQSQRPVGLRLPFISPGIWWAQFLAVFLTAGALCYLLARYFSSPIVKLRAATQKLAAGDLSARVGAASGRRRDELADLGSDFDVMAERMQTLMDSQQRLLHDISHELRSPLTRQKIALELARESDGEETRWALDRIEREADRLSDLINQLLTLARLENNSPVVNHDEVNLYKLVQEIILDADFEARSRKRAVRLITGEDCTITGNYQLLYSAIENVVRNAVSYTAEGTEVEVSLTCEALNAGKLQAVIRVLDHGPGVPQAALDEIFRPFYRVADARDRQSGGIGLGLSISQRAVQIHGGTVTAANASTGGLLVQIALPLNQQDS